MILAVAALCRAPVGGEEWTVRGSVAFRAAGKAAASGEHRAGTIVFFTPDQAVPSLASAGTLEIAMERKEFLPRVTHMVPGGSVKFPNNDPISHNVFSVSPGNSFDLGLYRKGEGETVTLDSAGVVQVFCNVHHSMAASILVLDTPHVTRLADDDTFELGGVAGPGRLTVWNDRAEPVEIALAAAPESALEIEVEITRARVPRHLNKFGKRYGRSRRDRDYQ